MIRTAPGTSHPSEMTFDSNDLTYAGFHARMRRYFGKPQECSVCGRTDGGTRYEWANLTGNYHDMRDYARMCKPCHMAYDRSRGNVSGAKRGGKHRSSGLVRVQWGEAHSENEARRQLLRLLSEHGSASGVARALGVSSPAIATKCRRLGIHLAWGGSRKKVQS